MVFQSPNLQMEFMTMMLTQVITFGCMCCHLFLLHLSGKTSIVPTNILLNMMGVARVRKFVVEEIVQTTLVEYVEKVNSQTHLSLTVVRNVAESTMY
jgi:hypothetical protein